MDKKIIFCNIAWMKYYEGIFDDDKPMNGGKYVDINKSGGECYNFQDFNGKCYGYFMMYGNLALENHFKDVKSTDGYVDNVLVIWVATNSNQQTKIVGWYKNARVYRSFQEKTFFTNLAGSLYYNIVADSKDCFLIPEDKRTFPIGRAAQSGTGTGMGRSNIWYAESNFARTILIPKVLEYIENYKGSFENRIYSDDVLKTLIIDNKTKLDYDELLDEGIKYLKEYNYYSALKYFNTANSLKETDRVQYYLGKCFYYFSQLDKAMEIFTSLEKVDEWQSEVLFPIMTLFDMKGNRDKTIEYGYKILELLGETDKEIAIKLYTYEVLFLIYTDKQEFNKAEEIINELNSKYQSKEAQEIVKNTKQFLKEQKNMLYN